MSVQVDAAFNYHELQGLESLKAGARNDSPEAIKAVAQQFESMFISLIMKSMRDATDVLSSDLENSYQTKFYRDMHDQQLSLSLSQSGGFGLADILYEQLTEAQNPTRFNPFDIDVKNMDESIRSILPSLGVGARTQSIIDELLKLKDGDAPSESEAPATGSSAVNSIESTTSIQGKSTVFEGPEDFIQSLLPIAEKAAKQLGLDPKIMVAQAALETGWGKAVIEKSDGSSSYNFFGIKSDHRWQGESAMTTTHEFIAGKKLTVNAPFRAYESAEKSFADYVDFVSGSERYQSAIENASDAKTYVTELQKAGYATDPDYAEKILRIANSEWFEQV